MDWLVKLGFIINTAGESGWLSALSFAATIIGFSLTLIGVMKSKKSSELAQTAAKQASEDIKKLKVITDLSAASIELEEIKRQVRKREWKEIPERLSRVRRLMLGTKSNHPEISNADHDAILNAIVNFSEIEKAIVRNLEEPEKLSAGKINAGLIDHTDKLLEVIARSI